MSELKSKKVGKEGLKSMQDILSKERGNLESAPTGVPIKFSDMTVLDRLDDLTLDDFTAQEREEFHAYVKAVKDHGAEVDIREWIPWWKHYEEVTEDGQVLESYNTLVEEITEGSDLETQALLNANLNSFVLYDDVEEDEGDQEDVQGDEKDDESSENPIADAFKVLMDELENTEEKKDNFVSVSVHDPESKEDKEYSFEYKDKIKLLKLRFKKIKPLKSLTAKAPSELLKYHIINTLFCFVFYYRLHNGDIIANPPTFNFDTMSN